ncbi:MAG: hypothetical protein IPJ77_00870 [Planctomycetes bacterium]|nr:hypothetical protein [Planctomycetota bacterium]
MSSNLLRGGLAALLLLAGHASAGVDQASSLLLFPCYDNTRQSQTFLTVTNTNDDPTAGSIRVEFVYINQNNCLETNRTRTLSPNDTITVATSLDNPNSVRGYVYVFAKSTVNGHAVKADQLIGTARFFGAVGSEDYEVQPFNFLAGAALAAGADTDLDHDGIRDLNGNEYEQAPAEIHLPRFFGQGPSANSQLVLINLTGGAAFQAIVDLLIYNDNEEVFSSQYQFRCWQKVPLLNVSNVFSDTFLKSTGHATGEDVLGVETGWIRINGNVAFSSAAQFQDPAVIAVLIENLLNGVGADLPFARGVQANGDLLPLSILGDNGL